MSALLRYWSKKWNLLQFSPSLRVTLDKSGSQMAKLRINADNVRYIACSSQTVVVFTAAAEEQIESV